MASQAIIYFSGATVFHGIMKVQNQASEAIWEIK